MRTLATVRRRGRRLRRRVQGAWFDWYLGVETRREVETSNHVGDHHGYEAADVWQLPKVLPRDEVEPSDVLVDVGAGKGRVLLFAVRHYCFARVIGVELSAELAAVAQANIQARPEAERARIVLVRADAASWIAPDDATVFHLFNPFVGETFRAFLAKVTDSQRRSPRPVRLIYTHGDHHADVLAAGFELMHTRPRYDVYQRRLDQERS